MPRPVQRKRAPGAALRAESCFFFLCALHPENGFPGAGRTGFTACAAAADGYGRTSCCAGTVGALVLFGKIFSDGYALFKENFADLALSRNAVVTAAVPLPPLLRSAHPAQFVLFHLAAQHRFPVCGPLVRLAVDNVGCNMIVNQTQIFVHRTHFLSFQTSYC